MVHAYEVQRRELADAMEQVGSNDAVIHHGTGVHAPVEVGPSSTERAQVGVALQHGVGVPPADHVAPLGNLHVGWRGVRHRLLISGGGWSQECRTAKMPPTARKVHVFAASLPSAGLVATDSRSSEELYFGSMGPPAACQASSPPRSAYAS